MDFNESRCSQPSQQLHGLQVMAQQNSALLVAAAALRPLSAHLFPLAPPYTRRHAAHYAGPGLSFRRRPAGPGLAVRPCLGCSFPIHRTVPSDFCRLCQLAGFFTGGPSSRLEKANDEFMKALCDSVLSYGS